jgi:ATP-dependent Lon protease
MHNEKLHIAQQFLLPKQVTQNGLSEAHIELTEPALLQMVMHYMQEAGVHSLERAIGGIVRYKAVQWAVYINKQGLPPSSLPPPPLPAPSETLKALVKNSKSDSTSYNRIVKVDELEKIIGLSHYDSEDREWELRRGVVWGLVVTGMGEGAIMPVESIATPGSGHLKLTGSLGKVRPELTHSYYPQLKLFF